MKTENASSCSGPNGEALQAVQLLEVRRSEQGQACGRAVPCLNTATDTAVAGHRSGRAG